MIGAASATGISQLVGGAFPLMYFIRENDSQLRLVPAKINLRHLGKTCFNGSSELMTNLSLSLVNMLFNLQLMKYAGENGVAAYGVIMYVNFIFVGVFIGYAFGSAPIIGYNYGAGNIEELRNVYRKSLLFNLVSGISMSIIAILTSGILAGIFVGNGLISTILSFLRTFLFQLVWVLVLPLIFDLDGIWLAIVVAEAMALVLSFVMLKIYKKKYRY